MYVRQPPRKENKHNNERKKNKKEISFENHSLIKTEKIINYFKVFDQDEDDDCSLLSAVDCTGSETKQYEIDSNVEMTNA